MQWLLVGVIGLTIAGLLYIARSVSQRLGRRLPVDKLIGRFRVPDLSNAPRVAVIGGGVAGCSAAYYLSQTGRQVTVFDQAERLGGRCRTTRVNFGKDAKWPLVLDTGCDEYEGSSKHVRDMVAELGIDKVEDEIERRATLTDGTNKFSVSQLGYDSFASLPHVPLLRKLQILFWRFIYYFFVPKLYAYDPSSRQRIRSSFYDITKKLGGERFADVVGELSSRQAYHCSAKKVGGAFLLSHLQKGPLSAYYRIGPGMDHLCTGLIVKGMNIDLATGNKIEDIAYRPTDGKFEVRTSWKRVKADQFCAVEPSFYPAEDTDDAPSSNPQGETAAGSNGADGDSPSTPPPPSPSTPEPESGESLLKFDEIVIATPAPQAAQLASKLPDNLVSPWQKQYLQSQRYRSALTVQYTVRMWQLMGRSRNPTIVPCLPESPDTMGPESEMFKPPAMSHLVSAYFDSGRLTTPCPPGYEVLTVRVCDELADHFLEVLEGEKNMPRASKDIKALEPTGKVSHVIPEWMETQLDKAAKKAGKGEGKGSEASKPAGVELGKLTGLSKTQVAVAQRVWAYARQLVQFLPPQFDDVVSVAHWREGWPEFEPQSDRDKDAEKFWKSQKGPVTFAGDYLAGPSIEGAFVSGVWAAGHLVGAYKERKGKV